MKKIIISLSLLFLSFVAISQNDEDKEKQDKRPSWSTGLPERQSTKELNNPSLRPDMDTDIEIDMSEFGIKPKAEIEIPIATDLPEPAEETESVEEVAVEELADEEVAVSSDSDEEQVVEPEQTEVTEIIETPVQSEAPQEISQEADSVNTEATNENDEAATTDQPVQSDVVETPSQEVEQEAVANNADDSSSSTDVNYAEYVWKIVKQMPVEYPTKAAIDNLEGWVDVEVTINANGEVVSASPVKYSRRGRVFGRAAVQSVNDWLFEPPSNSGIDTPQTRIYRIEFDL